MNKCIEKYGVIAKTMGVDTTGMTPEQAIADVCTPGNPRDVTEAEIVELYKKVL